MLLHVFLAVWSWQLAFFILGPEKGFRAKLGCQVTTVRARNHHLRDCLKNSRIRLSSPATKNKTTIRDIHKTSQLSNMKVPLNPRSQDEKLRLKGAKITTKIWSRHYKSKFQSQEKK
jgi:hypothetical protein